MKILNFCRVNLLFAFLLPASGKADILRSIPKFIHLHVSPNRGGSGSVGTLPPVATFAGFSNDDVGRWLTLANGPEFVNLLGGHSAAFTGRLNPDSCSVGDVPFPMALQTWDNKLDFFQLQTRQLNECVQFRIRDAAGIAASPEQPACNVTAINQYEAIAKGGLCYFRINPNSAFSVQYELNPECTNAQNFQKLELKPLDIFAYSGFYISGDASGRSTLLKPLGSGALRFSIEASAEQIPLSVDMGEGSPRWPVQAFPDVHMAEMDIQSKGRESRLLTRLFLRNSCNAENDIACRFSLPIGVQYTVKEILPTGAERMIDQWYAGGVSPAFWEGFFPSQRDVTNFEFKPGRRYRLEADLTYLSLYHRLFRDGFKSFLIQRGLWDIDPNSPLIPLRPVARMPGLDALKPNDALPVVSPLAPGGGNDFQLELNQMRALLTGIDWPPYFEEMCGPEKCAKAQTGQAKLKVGVEFTLEGFVDGVAKTKDYRVWRESSYSPEYNNNSQTIIRAVCQ
ncbi:hypothetical protein EBU99_12045 [bacterium]|nr:hypothetical protein [bacterium]